jgi:colanic acid biosynthesis protein WcaH
MLCTLEFLEVVRLTPLISIDMIASDRAGRILLARRIQRPARGSWVVPGGRIMKGEPLDGAFTRLAASELGIGDVARDATRFRGVFEHLYDDNFAGAACIPTHYVVLAYEITLDNPDRVRRDDCTWMHTAELAAHPDVHANTKAYFR